MANVTRDFRPNLYLAIADDWGYATSYTGQNLSTPAFDALARDGVIFTRAFSAAPTCTPARNALLFSRWPWRLGAASKMWSILPLGTPPSFFERLEAHGYHTGHEAKIYGPGGLTGANYGRLLAGPGVHSLGAFLAEAKASRRPWAFWHGNEMTHRAFNGHCRDCSGRNASDNWWVRSSAAEWLPQDEGVLGDLRLHAQCSECYSNMVGHHVAALRAAGELKRTLAIVTSDHGIPFPRAKGNLYDPGLRVGLIVWAGTHVREQWPSSAPPATVVDALVSTIDIAPTVLEAAGIPVPSDFDGESFLGALMGRVDGTRRGGYVLGAAEEKLPMRSYRDHHFLYIRNYEKPGNPERVPDLPKTNQAKDYYHGASGVFLVKNRHTYPGLYNLSYGARPAEELYDLVSDPLQLRNLSPKPDWAATLQRYSQKLDAVLLTTTDPRARGDSGTLDGGVGSWYTWLHNRTFQREMKAHPRHMPEGCEFTTTTLPSYLLERGGDSAHASGHAVAAERRARSSAGELAPPSPPCRIYVETPPECEPYTTMDDDPADQHSVYHWVARSVSIYPWRVASATDADLVFLNATLNPYDNTHRCHPTPWGCNPNKERACHAAMRDDLAKLAEVSGAITPSFGVSFHISGWMMGGPKNHPINGSIWMMMEPPKRNTPSVTPLIAPYVVHDSWISGSGSKPPPWAGRKLLFFASTIPKTYMKDYSGKNALIRFELWKRYRDDANVSVRASWRECAPGRCDALYYNHTDDRVPPELYRAEAMRHRFCVVAPGDTPATKKLAETIAFAAHGGCLPALYGGTAHLPYASQIDYSRIALLLNVEEGLGRLHAMTAAEAHERVAYARRVYHAFVQSEGASWETPSAAEVAIQEACRLSRGEATNSLLFSDGTPRWRYRTKPVGPSVAAPSVMAPASSCPRVLQLTLSGEHQLRLGWLDELPHSSELCAHLCLKGMSCGSEAVRRGIDGLQRMRVHSCVEEPGGHENGHEGVCAFRFLLDNYEAPWKHVFFLHGDVVTSHHAQQFKAFRAYLSRNEWPPWPRSRALMTAEHCGCGHWGGLLQPFGPRDFWHMGLTWWLGQMVEPREPTARALAAEWAAAADCRHGTCSRQGVGAYPLHNGTLSSPLGFMFAVDRAAALQRSRRFLEAQYRMCKVGVRVLPPGWTGAPTASRLAAQGFDYNPLVWGHVNERIPFFAFGHEFVERPVPDCLFEGNHATMNCTPPEASPAVHAGVHPHRRNASTGLPEVAPSVEWGCKPFDRGCGSVGR